MRARLGLFRARFFRRSALWLGLVSGAGFPGVSVPPVVPPEGAVRAGFTALALNYDYTRGRAKSIGCTADHSDMLPGKDWYQNGFTGGNNVVPSCNDINVVNDGGVSVLDLTWRSSNNHFGFYGGNVIQTENSNGSQVVGGGFPNSWIEARFRMANAVPTAAGSLWSNLFTWSVCGPQTGNTCPGILEMDTQEVHSEFPGNTFSAWHFWGVSGSTAGSPYGLSVGSGFDPAQYHTYASRLTSDGATGMSMCGYLDGVFKGCSAIPATRAPAVFNNRSYLILAMGWGCNYLNGQGLCSNATIDNVLQCPSPNLGRICVHLTGVGAYLQYQGNDPLATVADVTGITEANGLWKVKPANGTCCDVTWLLEGSTWPGGSYTGGGVFNKYTTAELMLQYVRVWSCPDWQTTMCNGAILGNAP